MSELYLGNLSVYLFTVAEREYTPSDIVAPDPCRHGRTHWHTVVCFGDGGEYVLLRCRHDYWRHWHPKAEESRFAVRWSRRNSIVLQPYHEVLLLLVFDADTPCPNRSEWQQDYAVNLRLFGLGVHIDADWV